VRGHQRDRDLEGAFTSGDARPARQHARRQHDGRQGRPGTYKVTVTCSGKAFTGWLVVAPRGAARTGDGASMLSSGGNVAAGTALAAAGLGVGLVAVRRRRAQGN
jgi:hypothetical protein